MKIKPISLPWKMERRGTVLVELSDRLLKLIQVAEERGQRRVVFLEALELDSQDDEKISQKLSLLLKRLPRRPGEIYASLPRSQITTRILFLPSIQPAELGRMVEFQLEKEIPFPKEKIIFDYHVIETTPEGYSRLLLVIAGEEVIRRYLGILKRSGLTPLSLFFSSQGLASWFQMTQGEKEKETFSVLIDMDLTLTHVEILHRGELYFTRSLLVGSQQMGREGETPVQETFLQELNRTLVAFKKEFPFAKMNTLFLSGASKIFPPVQKLLTTHMPYPVETILFRSHCPIEKSVTQEGIGEDVSFCSAVGFLLKDEKRMNLMPPSEKRARLEKTFRRSAAQFVLWVVGSLALLGFLFGTTLHERKSLLLSLQTELRRLEPAASEIESMQAQLDVLKVRERESEMILEILRELYQRLPPEAFLTYLVIEPQHLSLRGSSRNLSTVFSFAKALESSPFFKSVRVKNATRRTLSEGEVTLFQMDALIVTEKK